MAKASPNEQSAGNLIWFTPDDLSEFLTGLQDAHYNIGVGEYIAAQDLVVALIGRGVDLRQPARLKTLLGPLLVSTSIEQDDFAWRYAAWAEKVLAPSNPPPGLSTPKSPNNSKRWYRWLAVAVVGIVIVIGLIWQFMTSGRSTGGTIPTDVVSTPTALLVAFVTALMLIVLAILNGWWKRIFNQYLIRRSTTETPDLVPVDVSIKRDETLFPVIDYLRLAQGLRRRVELPSIELDVRRTVMRTVEKGGGITPVYGVRRVMPEYLVLVDRSSPHDHQTRFVSEMVNRLSSQQVFIAGYYFDGDPRLCFRMNGGWPVLLREVIPHGAQQRVILFSDGQSFFDPFTGELQPWMEMFQSMPERLLLTPKPVEHWTYSERQLEERFQVLPLTARGLETFIKTLEGAEMEPAASGRMTAWPPEELRLSPYSWLDSRAPEHNKIDNMLRSLNRYLGADGFLWLTACAFYPELRWEITLHLGAWLDDNRALVGLDSPRSDDDKLISPRRVVDLSRLPWFRHGSMPDWLRRELIISLQPDKERRIREALLGLWKNEPLPGDRRLLMLEIVRHELHRHDTQDGKDKYVKDHEDRILKDSVFQTFVLGGNFNRLAVRVPDQLQRALSKAPSGTFGDYGQWAFQLIAAIMNLPRAGPRPAPQVLDYRWLRLVIGVVILALPLVTFLSSGVLSSISASYYTGARDYYVGSLFFLAALLVVYKGRTAIESMVANMASLAAIVTAIAPTSCETCTPGIANYIHLSALAAFFLKSGVLHLWF